MALVLVDQILETRDPEMWGPGARGPGIPSLVTQDLEAILVKEEVDIFFLMCEMLSFKNKDRFCLSNEMLSTVVSIISP